MKKHVKQKKKFSNAKQILSKTSPNKLITDMFPITNSPNKLNSINKLIQTKKLLPDKQNTTIADEKVEDFATPIMIVDSDSCPSIVESDDLNIKQDTGESNDDSISLGGAVNIADIRTVVDEWIKAYRESGPLQNDVEDILRYFDYHKHY